MRSDGPDGSKQKYYQRYKERTKDKTGLQSRRHFTCRFWKEGNFHRGKGNAGFDGNPRKIRTGKPIKRRARDRVAAHDDPNSGLDRNPGQSWRECALGELQYFLNARSCCGSDREVRRLSVRMER